MATAPKLSPAQQSHVVELHLSGATRAELAEQFGVHERTIGRLLRRAGETKRYGSFAGITPDEVRQRILSGETAGQIAESVGAHDIAFRRWAQANGIEMAELRRQRRAAVRSAVLDDLRGSDVPYSVVSQKRGVSVRLISQWACQAGLRRKRSQGISDARKAVCAAKQNDSSLTARAIADEYDVPLSTVRSWLQAAGLS